ncbi:MAG: alpha/beta fold hydrolase [Alphaproteobacteria bacterium]|nr:alpha/beta fold hydrolase [Alphaproteobacteria bacterium]
MEVIRFGVANQRPPLLFIHGSYCGAWVWEKFFLPAFAQANWHGAAISLRGHGKGENTDRINSYGIADYLQDIDAGVKLFDQPPVLIGHSLGGYLAQKYALENTVKGLVLLAAPSLLGLNGSMQHIALNRPLLALQLGMLMTLGPAHVDLRVIGEALFSNAKTARQMEDILPFLQRESARVSLEASWPDFRQPKAYVPTLALGGDEDALVPEFEFRYEAQFWKGKSKILPAVAHAVMLDDSWPDVAREIMGWLANNFVG